MIYQQKSNIHILLKISTILCLILLTVSCQNESKHVEQKISENAAKDTSRTDSVKLNITYHIDSIANDSALKAFKSKYDATQLKIIAATNRIDINRIRIHATLIIPDTLLTDFTQYSPFPTTLNLPDSVTKFIIINKRIQLFAAYDHGKLAQFGPVSTGKKTTPTTSGLFYTNFKSRLKTSTVNGQWKMPWYFNISNHGGIGLHQYALPGYPASHSCVRMYEENAKWIYDWADQWQVSKDGSTVLKKGTPVLVFGLYNFGETAPWKRLPGNPKAIDLTEQELNEINDAIAKIEH